MAEPKFLAKLDGYNDRPVADSPYAGRRKRRTRCKDFDEDCYGIEDKVHCYLYDPTKGMCPFLSSHSPDIKDE